VAAKEWDKDVETVLKKSEFVQGKKSEEEEKKSKSKLKEAMKPKKNEFLQMLDLVRNQEPTLNALGD
jgi:hypothetical protein